MRITRAKMEGRINDVERNQREMETRTERHLQEIQNTLLERMAAMQTDIARLQVNRSGRSGSHSHRSSTSHRSSHRHYAKNDDSSESSEYESNPTAYQHDSRHRRRHKYHHHSPHHHRSLHHHRSTHHHSSRQATSSEGSENNSDYSPPRRHQHRDHHRYHRNHPPIGRKIELPLFNGEDAAGWLVRMNRYFRLNRTEEEDKIDVAVVAMEDQALSWFQWWEGQALQQNWNTFTQALTKRFQPDLVQDPLGPLFSLKQKGTIQEYRDKFEKAITSQGHLTEEVLRGAFLMGLRRDIRAELKLHRTRTLAEVMDTASAIENKNSETLFVKNKEEERKKVQNKNQNWGDGYRGSSSYTTKNPSGKYSVDDMKKEESSNSVQQITNPRLSQNELQERSRRGLCFKCGENWNRGHNCRMKNFKMVPRRQSEGEEGSENASSDSEEEKGVHKELKSMQLSDPSKEGSYSMKTFQVKGELKWSENEQQVNVSIDSGATHDFISQQLVERWQIPFQSIKGYKVQIGNGKLISNYGRCEGMKLNVQGNEIQQNFYMLELGGTDMVLGLEWLTNLGDMEVNFQNQIIKWKKQGLNHVIQGDGYWLYCEGQSTKQMQEQRIEGRRNEFIKEYPEVFKSIRDRMSWQLCNSAVKYIGKKMESAKLRVQKSCQYWKGRSARMKEKIKIVAVSYYPP
ncbi:unnamed protein product [Cuscuta epithymum]|uniref:Retrotransposon gag domain-containing protein n=1 Tax=Cuscuta epithymum TaxID=186058 RepID=A0AAV0DU36_9ASTE|nr:unnamed protein product [Cuscuta epithymum]